MNDHILVEKYRSELEEYQGFNFVKVGREQYNAEFGGTFHWEDIDVVNKDGKIIRSCKKIEDAKAWVRAMKSNPTKAPVKKVWAWWDTDRGMWRLYHRHPENVPDKLIVSYTLDS